MLDVDLDAIFVAIDFIRRAEHDLRQNSEYKARMKRNGCGLPRTSLLKSG